MTKLTVNDLAKINTLFPHMREDVKCLVCKSADLGAHVFCGLRTYEEQSREWAKGRNGDPRPITTNARPGQSFHQFGLAFDLAFIDVHGDWSWADVWPWEELGRLVREAGFHWGGDWTALKDRPHVERNYGFMVDRLDAIYQKHQQLSDVWATINATLRG